MNESANSNPFPKDLLDFDKTAVRRFTSFEEAEQANRRYWLSRTPLERMQALEHIRQLAWGYDAQSQPAFPRVVRSFQLGGG